MAYLLQIALSFGLFSMWDLFFIVHYILFKDYNIFLTCQIGQRRWKFMFFKGFFYLFFKRWVGLGTSLISIKLIICRGKWCIKKNSCPFENVIVATLLWRSERMTPSLPKWGRQDSQNFKIRLQGSKHLASKCSLYHWKAIKV